MGGWTIVLTSLTLIANVQGPAIERHQRQTRRQITRRPRMKLCTVCGVVTSRPGSRCGEHPRLSGIGANHHVHADPRWARLSKRMIARHVGQYGYVCPGDGPAHPAHSARDLTLDHVVALSTVARRSTPPTPECSVARGTRPTERAS